MGWWFHSQCQIATTVEAVQTFPTPGTKTDVRAFLGLMGCYRKFIPGYVTISSVLSYLTRKSAPNRVVWTPQCERAFVELKKLLCSAPVLKAPDLLKPFIYITKRCFWSWNRHHFKSNRYSTVEKECLAIKLATHAFRVYLLGRKFIIQTDHHSFGMARSFKREQCKID